MPKTRYQDTGFNHLHNASDEAWVVCPRCSGPALVRHGRGQGARTGANGSAAHRLTCTRCSTQRGAGQSDPTLLATPKPGRDACFGLPFWLSVDTRHGALWAQNARHIDELERIVRSDLRERKLVAGGATNRGRQRHYLGRSLLAVLPRWVKLAKNRADVLSAIAKLRAKLAETTGQSS